MPDVARREETGYVGFEIVRGAVERPSFESPLISVQIRARHEITRFITHHAEL
jgi:hypothetical protein